MLIHAVIFPTLRENLRVEGTSGVMNEIIGKYFGFIAEILIFESFNAQQSFSNSGRQRHWVSVVLSFCAPVS